MKKLILAGLLLTLAFSLSCGGGSGGGGGGGDDGSGGSNGNPYSYKVTIFVTEDENGNGICDSLLDDSRLPFKGNENFWYFTSLDPVSPEQGIKLIWEAPHHGYIASFTLPAENNSNFWVAIYGPDLGSVASPGSYSPAHVAFVRMDNLQDGGTCVDLLVHYVAAGKDKNGNYMYGFQIQSIDPSSDCPVQGEDNRTAIFSGG